jgi:hypothetical protein
MTDTLPVMGIRFLTFGLSFNRTERPACFVRLR